MSDSERTVDDVLGELTPIFRDVFGEPDLVVGESMMAKDVEGWDSLTHMELIVAVEEHYGIKFRLGDVVKFRNVGDMCRAILAVGR